MGNPKKAKRGIPPKSEFNSWYPSIVEIADLVDKRYPIKGMDVWKPYGLRAMSLIDSLTRNQMSMTDHHEHRFPLLVPENLLDKENKLVSRLKAAREAGVDPSELRMDEEDSGFKKEVYWVTHGGENELDSPMFLRPTSETPMYTMFSLWVRSHTDLPLKTFQIVNTFRYETKQTRSFTRLGRHTPYMRTSRGLQNRFLRMPIWSRVSCTTSASLIWFLKGQYGIHSPVLGTPWQLML